MPRLSEQAREITYPQLSRDRLDAIIDALLFAGHNRAEGPMTRRYESAAGYLIGFYTKRWGLPPCVRQGTHRGRP